MASTERVSTDRQPARQAGDDPDRQVRRLLTAAAATGPVFFGVAAAQAFAREGFDPREHPISQLATGGLGWIQVANFVLAGGGVLALAVAQRRRPTDGFGRRTIPALVAVFGVGLVLAGLFPMDPEHGFPVGTPEGPVESMSWHGIAHAAAAATAFTALALACLAASVRAVRQHRTVAALGHGAAALVLLAPVAPAGVGVQVAVTGLTAFTWTTLAALSLRRNLSARAAGRRDRGASRLEEDS